MTTNRPSSWPELLYRTTFFDGPEQWYGATVDERGGLRVHNVGHESAVGDFVDANAFLHYLFFYLRAKEVFLANGNEWEPVMNYREAGGFSSEEEATR